MTLHETDGRWTVAERADYPADVAKLRKLLLALSDAKIVEEKTSDPASFPVIGVEDPSRCPAPAARKSPSSRKDGKHAVIVGKPVGEGNFARRAGENMSYSVEPGDLIRGRAALLDRFQLIDVRPDIQSIRSSRRRTAYTVHAASPAHRAAAAAPAPCGQQPSVDAAAAPPRSLPAVAAGARSLSMAYRRAARRPTPPSLAPSPTPSAD